MNIFWIYLFSIFVFRPNKNFCIVCFSIHKAMSCCKNSTSIQNSSTAEMVSIILNRNLPRNRIWGWVPSKNFAIAHEIWHETLRNKNEIGFIPTEGFWVQVNNLLQVLLLDWSLCLGSGLWDITAPIVKNRIWKIMNIFMRMKLVLGFWIACCFNVSE